jgi:hypothetical protein
MSNQTIFPSKAMELLLSIWTLALGLWTLWLFISTSQWHKQKTQLYIDQVRWIQRCEKAKREGQWTRNG